MDKKVIIVKDVVSGTSTNAEGTPLFVLMDSAIKDNKVIVLSLKSCPAMSTSFLNSSIGTLVERYGMSLLKNRLIITDYTTGMAESIKRYLSQLKDLVLS